MKGFARAITISALFACGTATMLAADSWTVATPEELRMTSDPHVLGAPAIYLNYEETMDDSLFMYARYVRIKVLTEEGKKFSDVELKFLQIPTSALGTGSTSPLRWGFSANNLRGWAFSVDDIQGRTVHPDGTSVPFTGKPFEKTIVRNRDFRYKAKVFTLPDVQVGDIIEYRYKVRWDNRWFNQPVWMVQQDLFARSVHFVWKPSSRILTSASGRTNESIMWYPLLPKGVEVVASQLPPAFGSEQGQRKMELTAKDIPAVPDEEFMPPIAGLSYRVMFYYARYKDTKEFWREAGRDWSKEVDDFASPSDKVKRFAMEVTEGVGSDEERLKRLYAAVTEMDNTDFSREHSIAEDKVVGLKEPKSAEDILLQKRGTSGQLTCLFVALARSLNMSAYVMAVTNRDRSLFIEGFLTLQQLDDNVAIVVVDRKEKYFDPGSKYTPFGHLYWKHTAAGGIRQSAKDVMIATTPSEDYTFSSIERVADVNVDIAGSGSGTVWLKFSGNPAIRWRQMAASTDEIEVKKELKAMVEQMLPDGVSADVQKIDFLESTEDPLKVTVNIDGPIATPTVKRVILPGDLFEARSKPMFPHEKRDLAVYFEYELSERDAVRYTFPIGSEIEALPIETSERFRNDISYTIKSEKVANSITVRRDFYRSSLFYAIEDYSGVRSFFNKLQTQDQQNVILQVPATTAIN